MRKIRWLVWIVPFVLLAPVLAGRALFWGTPALQFVPWRWAAWLSLRAGEWPLWDPNLGMGAPLLANYQLAFFYPPTWISYLLAAIGGLPALAWGQGVLVALHLAWAGWGMVRLAESLGLNPLAQTVAGLAYGLSGYLVARAGFLSINAATAWLPWLLWALTCLPRVTPLSGVTAMLLLAGHAQTAWYSLLLTGLWWLFRCFALRSRPVADAIPLKEPLLPLDTSLSSAPPMPSDTSETSDSFDIPPPPGPSTRFIPFCLPLVAVFLALALSAVQLLPTVEYLLQSQRASAVDFDFAMTYSFWPWHFLNLLSPHFFGSPVTGDYWGYANYWEDALYLGLLPLGLALVALFRRSTPLRGFWAGVIVAGFLLALGRNTPIFPWLYRHVLTFDMFQAPARWLLWPTFALALLAGYGAHGWRRPRGRALYWTRLGTAAAGGMALMALLAMRLLPGVYPTFARAAAGLGLWGLGSGLLSLNAPADGRLASRWSWAVALWVVLDLLIAGWGLNPALPLDFYRDSVPQIAAVREAVGAGRLFLPADDEYDLKFNRFFRFDTFDPGEDWLNLRAVVLPDLSLLDGIPSANNFDPLLPGRYVRWMEALKSATGVRRKVMLALMGVSLVERMDASAPNGVRFEPRAANPRAWWVQRSVMVWDDDEAWEQTMANLEGLSSVVVLVGRDLQGTHPARVELEGDRQAEESARREEKDPRRVVLLRETFTTQTWRVNAPTNGWLVVADVWYPGWRASVDGVPVPVLRANYLFRAVAVPAGSHQVVLTYRPWTFSLGLLLSLLALASWMFLYRRGH